MKIGTRLVGKNSGTEWHINRTATTDSGDALYLVALHPESKDGTWYTLEKIRGHFDVLRDEVSEQRVETLEIGDIVIGDLSGDKYEVVAKTDTEITMYDWGDRRLLPQKSPRYYHRLSHYTLPIRHRFYIKSNTLYVDPPLDLIEGVHDPLELSIRKWEVIAETNYVLHGLRGDTCALCCIYAPTFEGNCDGCPVKEHTGKSQCTNTPYYDYVQGKSKKAAREMVEFLKSLREPEFKVGDLVLCGDGWPCRVVSVRGSLYDTERLDDGNVYRRIGRSGVTPLSGHHFYVRDGILGVCPVLTGKEPDPLALSIQKWQAIVRELEDGGEIEGDGREYTCALCHTSTLYEGNVVDCSKCPVAFFTDKRGCKGTPYEWWGQSNSLAAARAELEFLKELQEHLDEDAQV